MYRNADYERDWDRLSTASHPVGLLDSREDPVPIRRTNSANDVSRFHRYFQLLHRLSRMTWPEYEDLLRQDFKRVSAAYQRPKVLQVPSAAKSERSCYLTACESPGSLRPEVSKEGDDFSISSASTLASGSSRSWSNLAIKKIRKETKTFARGIFKSLDVLHKIQSKKFESSPVRKKEKKHVVKTVVQRDYMSSVPSIYGSQRSVSSSCVSSRSSARSGGGDSLTLRKLSNGMLTNVQFF